MECLAMIIGIARTLLVVAGLAILLVALAFALGLWLLGVRLKAT